MSDVSKSFECPRDVAVACTILLRICLVILQIIQCVLSLYGPWDLQPLSQDNDDYHSAADTHTLTNSLSLSILFPLR